MRPLCEHQIFTWKLNLLDYMDDDSSYTSGTFLIWDIVWNISKNIAFLRNLFTWRKKRWLHWKNASAYCNLSIPKKAVPRINLELYRSQIAKFVILIVNMILINFVLEFYIVDRFISYPCKNAAIFFLLTVKSIIVGALLVVNLF